jgi:hypothetical protein
LKLKVDEVLAKYSITDRAHIIETGTESYRFKRTVAARKKAKE